MRARGVGLRGAWPALLLAVFLVPTYVDHSRDLESDGILYYSYLRSVLFDGDLDLRNDFTLLGWANPNQRNVLPIGAPILWSPLLIAIHLGRQAARLFGAGPPSGVEPVYQGAACLATLAYGAAGLFLLAGALRRWTFAAAALWATVLCWIGSPLRFYLSVLPGLAHGAEFFAAVLVLRAYLALRDRPDVRRAALAGAACGLLFLVRSQDGLLLSLPGLELAARLVRGPDRRGPARALVALLGAFALAALPQMIVWQLMFGVPFLVPHKVIHGAGFMHAGDPELLGTLFSPRGGLFVNYPAMLAAAVGLALLALRRDRRYVALVLPSLLAVWYINSTIFDWYHVRRFTGVVPFLAPGLAWLIAPLCRVSVIAPALLAFAVLRFDLAVDYLRPLPGAPVTMRAAADETVRRLAEDGYRILEPAAPGLAVRVLRPYTGSVLGDGPTRIDLGGDAPLLRLPLRARNLSEPEVEDGVLSRWVRERDARLFLPLASPSALAVTIRARALETVEPQFMEIDWNGTTAGRQPMTPAWADYRYEVPAQAVRAGTNEIVLRFDRAPLYRRVRRQGPHEVRPAAIASITLERR